MEFEAVDDGSIVKIIVPEGTDNVLVGTVIAIIGEAEESAVEDAAPCSPETPGVAAAQLASISAPSGDLDGAPVPVELERPHATLAGNTKITPLAPRIAGSDARRVWKTDDITCSKGWTLAQKKKKTENQH